MDLRTISNGVANAVNENIFVAVLRSTGYTIGAGQRQVPSYAAPVTGPAQVQALTFTDLKQLDGLNIQGTALSIYLRGALAGVIRPQSQGGDLIQLRGHNWLVVKVLESWPTWTKACIVLQEAV